MHPSTFLSRRQVAARYGVDMSTIWRWSESLPDFPRQVTLSPGCVRWKLSDLEAWEAERAAV